MRNCAFALATAFGVLAGVAYGSPVYLSLNQTVDADETVGSFDVFDLDFNGDGIFDVAFVSGTAPAGAQNDFYALADGFNATNAILSNGARLSAGMEIGASGAFTTDPSFFVRTLHTPGSPSATRISGLWRQENQVGVTGFLGLSFDISGATHYGWVQIEVPAEGVFFDNEIRLIDAAYESAAGQSILAGDTGPAPVPLPASALLLLGGLGLLRFSKGQA